MSLPPAEREAGNLDAATAAATQALAELGEVQADDVTICEAFVVDLDRLRAHLGAAKRRAEAVQVAAQASDLATRLAERDEATYAALLGTTWVNEAGARAAAGDRECARALNEEAIGLLEQHAPQHPALTTALANRAHLQRSSGEWTDAVATEHRLLADVRASGAATRAEVDRLNTLFITLVRAGRREEAEQTIGEAVEVARHLVAADPACESLLATLLGNQANVRGELQRYDDALASSEEALAIRERRAATHPSRESDQGLAMILNNHSAVLRRVGRVSDAAVTAARSVEVRRRLAQDATPGDVALLANSLNTHAEQLGLLGDGPAAVRLAEEAHELFASLPPPGAVTRLLRANQDTLGRALSVAGRHDDAVVAAERAVAIGRQAAGEAPGEVPELASCLESLADRLTAVGRGEDAEAALVEARELRAALAT
jgi:tetratricopeptide (TPR) repeat protein